MLSNKISGKVHIIPGAYDDGMRMKLSCPMAEQTS